jgi:DNA-binding HxlR family transcriptional regulator
MIDLLGKSHVLELHYFLFKSGGPVRFNELRRELSITATTLSRRLEEFAVLGLVEREVFAEVPARVEYSLSQKGLSLGRCCATYSLGSKRMKEFDLFCFTNW